MPIPVLMYHNIVSKNERNKYTLTIDFFRQQMAYLQKNHYHTLTAEKYLKEIEEGAGTLEKKIVLTFDDSYVNYYKYTFPILKELNLKANFFITTGHIGKEGQLSWQNLIEMKNEGMSIQSHTVTHRFLGELKKEEIIEELKSSKSIIEDRIGSVVECFSCPGGRFNKDVIEAASELGYKAMFTSIPGFNHQSRGNGLMVFERFLITKDVDLSNFSKIVQSKSVYSKRIKYYFKRAINKVLGNRLYYSLWRKAVINE